MATFFSTLIISVVFLGAAFFVTYYFRSIVGITLGAIILFFAVISALFAGKKMSEIKTMVTDFVLDVPKVFIDIKKNGPR